MKIVFYYISLLILISSCFDNDSHYRVSDLRSPDSTNSSIQKLEKYVNLKAYPPISVSFRYYDKEDSKSTLPENSNYDVIVEAILYYDYNIAKQLDSSCHCLLEKNCNDTEVFINILNNSMNFMPSGNFEFEWLNADILKKIKSRKGFNCSDRAFNKKEYQFIGFIPIGDRIILKSTENKSSFYGH